jgi:hypothetical protein
MLKIDPNTKTLVQISPTNLKQSNILERTDFQQAIVQSWDAFCSEMGYEELFLIGSEITPHDSCRDRIDILGLSRDGRPVVFELKRHREKLQLLQAISYAAMVAKWEPERFLKELENNENEDTDELRAMLHGEGFALSDPEIVLVAESFDPEVILAADWLSEFGVPISAFSISAVEHGGDVLLSIDQRFPLAGVDDVYVRRARKPGGDEKESSWDDAIKACTFPFAQRALAVFQRRSAGNPSRRSFYSIYAGSPLGRMRINFKQRYLKIYTQDQSPESEQALQSRIGEVIDIKRWGSESTKNSGFTFTIETESQFEKFLQAVGEKTP